MRDIINKLEELNVEKSQQLNEGLGDMAHEVEKDHEVQMARSDLYKTAKYAVAIHKMLKDVSEMEGIDGWVQAKITKAADYLGAVKHHMEGEIMQDVELAVVPVAGDMTDAMDVPQESVEVIEAEERDYICVHAKKGRYECSATSSYGAAKKAAEHWGLKNTAGIDAHLADEKKTATESIEVNEHDTSLLMKVVDQIKQDAGKGLYHEIDELLKDVPTEVLQSYLSNAEAERFLAGTGKGNKITQAAKAEAVEEADGDLSMMVNSSDKVERVYGEILQGVRGRGPAEESEVGDYIPSGMTRAEIMQLIDMLEPQGYDKDFLMKDLAPMMKEDSLHELDGPVATHDVKKGDTLYSLAKKHNTTVDRLKQMNRQDDDKIKVGQKLNVPEDTDVIGDIISKLPNTKAGQKGNKDVIGDIIKKLPAMGQPGMDKGTPKEPTVSTQQKQKMLNKAVNTPTPKTLPKAPPQRPERIRSFAQDTTAPLSMMQNWSKK